MTNQDDIERQITRAADAEEGFDVDKIEPLVPVWAWAVVSATVGAVVLVVASVVRAVLP